MYDETCEYVIDIPSLAVAAVYRLTSLQNSARSPAQPTAENSSYFSIKLVRVLSQRILITFWVYWRLGARMRELLHRKLKYPHRRGNP